MQLNYEKALEDIPNGMYRHFKGHEYMVIGIGVDSETAQPLVIYRENKPHSKIWVRPASMWYETVEKNGQCVTRFTKL